MPELEQLMLHRLAEIDEIVRAGYDAFEFKRITRTLIDFMVVEPAVNGRRREMVRLREVLRPLRIPVDVLVVDRELSGAWKDKINNVVREAAREGKVYAA